jgi:hypothetical protein
MFATPSDLRRCGCLSIWLPTGIRFSLGRRVAPGVVGGLVADLSLGLSELGDPVAVRRDAVDDGEAVQVSFDRRADQTYAVAMAEPRGETSGSLDLGPLAAVPANWAS